MKKYLLLCLTLFLSSCTWSVIMNHTEGQASDVVDETVTPSNSVNLPVDINSKNNPAK